MYTYLKQYVGASLNESLKNTLSDPKLCNIQYKDLYNYFKKETQNDKKSN